MLGHANFGTSKWDEGLQLGYVPGIIKLKREGEEAPG
jgi:hypothetical protein